ncbi:MAG: glutamate 5-kinase [bacterium]|nr:glutamate 5-kinase [bacterium]
MNNQSAIRNPKSAMRRIVVKVGTSILTSDSGELTTQYISKLVESLSNLRRSGLEIILVSSGAVGAGMKRLGLTYRPKSIPLKQAAAAVGQSRLMQVYEHLFGRTKQKVAQILLTHHDLADRRSYINTYNTLLTLLEYRIIPIINENDPVAVEEIKFGDNDTLAALVANLIEADALLLLTNTDGFYSSDPKTGQGELIHQVDEITDELLDLAGGTRAATSTGGMITKLQAARIAVKAGIRVIIANGKKENIIEEIMNGIEVGTVFLPLDNPVAARKRWIEFHLHPKGEIVVDAGAVEALLHRGKSLLPSGILEVKGSFGTGEAVVVADKSGKELAKGLTNYSSYELEKIKGKQTSRIDEILGYKYYDEVIHRDNLALLT